MRQASRVIEATEYARRPWAKSWADRGAYLLLCLGVALTFMPAGSRHP
jgi:hypothetical protein